VDLADMIDVPRLRATAGDYLVGLGTVAADGTWPADDGLVAGAPMAVEAESLVWYPKAAFERASYEVPRTWAELEALTARMIADGNTPWCLGLAEGMHPASGAVDIVEDLVLHEAGRATYDGWAAGSVRFGDEAVSGAFAELGDLVFDPGSVLGGADGALATQQDLADWSMFVDPPGCWLHLAGGTGRKTWPEAVGDTLASFPFPAADADGAGAVRGRVFDVVVFRDRPEVRRLVEHLLGEGSGASLAGSLVPAGIWPVAPAGPVATADEGAAAEGKLLRSALDAGTFRVAASDLMPTVVADAFAEGTVRYVADGRLSLASILEEIQRSWRKARQ
jgi:alpha-glucoside transport system substrate-binding protein